VDPDHRRGRIFVTDCEGPLTINDNAQEIAEHFIPDGAEFFARLSKYDDVLADLERRPGYNAGDTLRLLPPFLVAYEVTDREVERFSAERVLLVPGALKMLFEVRALMPAFIISTSYTPYIRALCDLSGFPQEDCRCTDLSLDDWHLPHDEKAWLRDAAAAVLRRPLIEIPDGARTVGDLSPDDRATVADLDELFWTAMSGRVSGELLAAVRPVGGDMKLAALEQIVATRRCAGADVMYVGDSITDVPPLGAVKRWGGVSLSFNGNRYALAAAEFAAAALDAAPTARLATAFARGGREAVLEAARAWPRAKPGQPATGLARARVGVLTDASGVPTGDSDALAEASLANRRAGPGERVARLG
jgi:energy-converting hydrogenase A subunit R